MPKTKQRSIPQRWHAIANGEVNQGLTFKDAGIKAGYSKSYIVSDAYQHIANDPRYSMLKRELGKANEAKSEVTVAKVREMAYKILNACLDEQGNIQDKGNALRANEQLGRTIAAFVDKQINEDSEAQQALDEHQAAEARRLASIRLMSEAG